MELKLSTLGVAATITVVALTGAACSSGSKSSSTSSTSSSSSSSASSSTSAAATSNAAPVDYTTLLIKPEDIVVPNDTFTAEPPQLNPGGSEGVAVGFDNADKTRSIGDSITVMPDASAAKTAMDGAVAALNQSIANPSPQPAPVGSNGVVASGTSPDGTKAVTVVTFTEGKAFVVMQFDSPAGDAVPNDFATSLAQKQADNIKSGLG